jgi:hypothetical protein
VFFCRINHTFEFILTAEIAGVDADGLGTVLKRSHGQPGIKMDIGNERKGYLVTDGTDCPGRLHFRHRNPDNLTACLLKPQNLGHCRLDISGIGIGHGLNRDGRATADCDISYPDLAGIPA